MQQRAGIFIGMVMGFLLLSTTSYGQLNLVSGYTGGYFQADQYDEIIDRYNASLDSTQRVYKGINILNGVSLGLNYKMDVISLELLWTERFKFDQERRVDLSNGNERRSRFNTNYRSISFGVNFHVDNFLIGTSINADYLLQRIQPPQGTTIRFTKEQIWSSRFHVGFLGEINQQSAFSLQPFVHIPWSEFNIAALDRQLNKSAATDIREDFLHFGISLILYNGPQR